MSKKKKRKKKGCDECHALSESLMIYVDEVVNRPRESELSSQQREAVRKHLRACPSYRAERDVWKAIFRHQRMLAQASDRKFRKLGPSLLAASRTRLALSLQEA